MKENERTQQTLTDEERNARVIAVKKLRLKFDGKNYHFAAKHGKEARKIVKRHGFESRDIRPEMFLQDIEQIAGSGDPEAVILLLRFNPSYVDEDWFGELFGELYRNAIKKRDRTFLDAVAKSARPGRSGRPKKPLNEALVRFLNLLYIRALQLNLNPTLEKAEESGQFDLVDFVHNATHLKLEGIDETARPWTVSLRETCFGDPVIDSARRFCRDHETSIIFGPWGKSA